MSRRTAPDAAALPNSRAAAMARAGYRCEAADHRLPGCTGRPELIHHIGRRRGDDPHHPDNLLAICNPCHLWIHANSIEAVRLDLLRRSGPAAPPLYVRRPQ